MSATLVWECAVWWMLARYRHIRCNLQVTLWAPCVWGTTIKALYKSTSFTFLPLQCCCTPSTRDNQPSGNGMGDSHCHFSRSVAQLWNRLITNFGEKCSSGSTRRTFMTLMNWSRASWCGLEQSMISDAISEWRKHLRVCIRAKGRH